MGTYYTERKIFQADVVLTSATDVATFNPVVPVDIIRWGLVVTTTILDVGAGMTLALDHEVTAGSGSGRVEIDTIVRTSDVLLGKGIYKELILPVSQATAEDGSLRDVSGTGPFQVDPGEAIVFQVTDQADTNGAVTVFLEYYELPQNLDTRNSTNMTIVTS